MESKTVRAGKHYSVEKGEGGGEKAKNATLPNRVDTIVKKNEEKGLNNIKIKIKGKETRKRRRSSFIGSHAKQKHKG